MGSSKVYIHFWSSIKLMRLKSGNTHQTVPSKAHIVLPNFEFIVRMIFLKLGITKHGSAPACILCIKDQIYISNIRYFLTPAPNVHLLSLSSARMPHGHLTYSLSKLNSVLSLSLHQTPASQTCLSPPPGLTSVQVPLSTGFSKLERSQCPLFPQLPFPVSAWALRFYSCTSASPFPVWVFQRTPHRSPTFGVSPSHFS